MVPGLLNADMELLIPVDGLLMLLTGASQVGQQKVLDNHLVQAFQQGLQLHHHRMIGEALELFLGWSRLRQPLLFSWLA